MNNFLNDYKDFGNREIYEKIEKIFKQNTSGYGQDEISNRARDLIKKEIKRECDIEFISGGTAANILATTFNLRPFEAVLSASTGHITHHETGSIEATGHKVVTLNTDDGKLKPEDIKELLENQAKEIDVEIKLIYISNTTEVGTVYTLSEIEEIYDLAKKNNLYLYIDGARIAHAMAASDMSLSDIAKNCDIFSLGGTKNGAIFGEAMIILNDDLKKNFRSYMKQRGAMMAKLFLIGISFETLFEDGLYYKNAQHAYKMSRLLVDSLKEIGREPVFGESNQVFIKSNPEEIEKLSKENLFEVDNKKESIIRLVTDYRTTEKDIEGFIEGMKKC